MQKEDDAFIQYNKRIVVRPLVNDCIRSVSFSAICHKSKMRLFDFGKNIIRIIIEHWMHETDNNNLSFSFYWYEIDFFCFFFGVPNTKSADAFQLFRIKCEFERILVQNVQWISFLLATDTVQCVHQAVLCWMIWTRFISTTMASNIFCFFFFALTHCLFLSKGFIKGIWPPANLQ